MRHESVQSSVTLEVYMVLWSELKVLVIDYYSSIHEHHRPPP
jgi:hypothetical protein